MAKKILKTLVNNLGFKILAVVLAFILWLVVYNIDDPKKSKTFTTNVTVENASAVTDMNKCHSADWCHIMDWRNCGACRYVCAFHGSSTYRTDFVCDSVLCIFSFRTERRTDGCAYTAVL